MPMEKINKCLRFLFVIYLSTTGSNMQAQTTSFTQSADTVCYEGNVNFYNTSTGIIDSFVWVVNGYTLHSDSTGANFQGPGNDTVRLYVYRGTVTDTAYGVVYVRPLQYTNTLIDSAGLLVETIRPAICTWYCNGAIIPGATGASFHPLVSGCYYAIVDTGGCYFGITDTVCTFAAEVNTINAAPLAAQVYPNPATTLIIISKSDRITTVAITDILGQTVYSKHYNAPQVQVDVSNLPIGVYFVKINGTEVRKFVKE